MLTLNDILLLQLEGKLNSSDQWDALSRHKLSNDVIRNYLHKLNINILCTTNVIPEDIIISLAKENACSNCIIHIIRHQQLSDRIIIIILDEIIKISKTIN